MSKRAEKLALKAYPNDGRKVFHTSFGTFDIDHNAPYRKGYAQGYERAEKDIISLIEFRLSELLGDAQQTPILRYELRDLIKKIKEDE